MERLKTVYEWQRPRFKANNITDVLASRDLFVDAYAAWYEEQRKSGQLPKIYGPQHPTQKSTGKVEIPLVGHDPKKDKPESILDVITFALTKITLFDARAELETTLYSSDKVSRLLFEPLAEIGQPPLPTNQQLKETTWASGVSLNYSLGRRFGRPTAHYYLAGISNPNISGGKPVLTQEARLRQLGFDTKR